MRVLVKVNKIPLIVLVFLIVGCSPGFQSKVATGGSGNDLGSLDRGLVDNGDLIVLPGQRTTSVVFSNQVLKNMLSVTGVTEASVDATNYWRDKLDSFSEEGLATSVTGPMLMAVAGLAAEVCDDLIDQELEANQRRIFNAVDFSAAPTSLTSTVMAETVRRMARSFWGRNETSSELDKMINGVNDGMNGSSSTRDWVLFSCTGMLSSLDAIQI